MAVQVLYALSGAVLGGSGGGMLYEPADHCFRLLTPAPTISHPQPRPPAATENDKIALWIVCLLFGLIALCITVEHVKGMDPLTGMHEIKVEFHEIRAEWRYALFELLLHGIDGAARRVVGRRTRGRQYIVGA